MEFLWAVPLLVLAAFFLGALGEGCPEGSGCSTGHTCCPRFDGSTSCCPLPNAVCCPGGDTCCSSGETCSSGACYKGIWVWPMLRYKGEVTATLAGLARGETKLAGDGLSSSGEVEGETLCPDGTHCGSRTTCCRVDDDYGCCPLSHAVCCPDQAHCCPKDTVCSLDSTSCLKPDVTMTTYRNSSQVMPPSPFNQIEPWIEKQVKPKSTDQVKLTSILSNSGHPVICPDKSQCVPGATCCKLGSGYGCCPMPNAVCCKDGQHCCQEGTRCGKDRCIASNDSIFTNAIL